VALLKKVIQLTQKSQPLPEGQIEGVQLNLFPKVVLDCRINDGGQQKILLKWKNLPEFERSWEEVFVIVEHFPQFHLEDDVNTDGSSIVRT